MGGMLSVGSRRADDRPPSGPAPAGSAALEVVVAPLGHGEPGQHPAHNGQLVVVEFLLPGPPQPVGPPEIGEL